MKKLIFISSILLSSFIYTDEPVETFMVVGNDPTAGVIHILCIAEYKFAIYQNSRIVRTAEGYAGESQSSSMTQILDDRGRGIKCSK